MSVGSGGSKQRRSAFLSNRELNRRIRDAHSRFSRSGLHFNVKNDLNRASNTAVKRRLGNALVAMHGPLHSVSEQSIDYESKQEQS
jgi:hypothetical protein